MKHTYKLAAAFLLLAVLWVSAGEMRLWKNTVGDEIEAEFIKETAGTVYLRTADGKELKIKRNDLTPEGQAVVAELTNPFPKKNGQEKEVEATKELAELFGEKILDKNLKSIPVSTLNGKIIGIYFSAHWCPPCRQFTPELVKFHNELQKKGKPFEIVFVSSDQNVKAMKDYIKEEKMNWLAMPFGDSRGDKLSKKYGIGGIPSLIIIDSKGNLITKNGRGDVSGKGVKAFDGWEKTAK